ncbi:MAG: hypothetical protein AB2A00_22735 [Myxococcota bacterium]
MDCRRGAAGLVMALLVAGGGCAALAKRGGKDAPVLIKDPSWIGGDCQAEMRSKNVEGLCAVVTLAKATRPQAPGEVARHAVDQAKSQLAEKVKNVLVDAINKCATNCGNLSGGPPKPDLAARLSAFAVNGARVMDLWLAKDDNLYALVAVDVGSIVSGIQQDPDLDQAAKDALASRARDALKR